MIPAPFIFASPADKRGAAMALFLLPDSSQGSGSPSPNCLTPVDVKIQSSSQSVRFRSLSGNHYRL